MSQPETEELDLLILLPWEEGHRQGYERHIQRAYPRLFIRTVGKLEEARALIPAADIFMSFGASLHEDIFGDARRLRWVHAFGTGLDGIVDQPGLGRDVIVTATRGIHGAPLSEIAIMLMLALARDFPRSVRAQQQREWDRFRAQLLYGKTVGVFGVGQIARDLAPRLKALGMRVIGVTRTARDLPGFDEMRSRSEIYATAAECDYLILLVPLEPDTRRVVDGALLRAMKPTAFLVNIARGALVDESALIEALKEGRLAGAALDTTEKEPLPADDPLWDAPNLILTPHLGGFYDAYVEDSIEQILHNLTQFYAGRFEAMLHRDPR
jgi:D-2-hydroxyacid dehydrogenase (NADP+)